nr:beta-ketoacyl-[acyl-carrier-protein] synthase family protein [Pirellula staleyi]
MHFSLPLLRVSMQDVTPLDFPTFPPGSYMPTARDVVITGLGVVSPIGVGREAFWGSLTSGKSGIRAVTELGGTDLPFAIGGEVVGFEPKEYVQPRKTLKVMCREIQAGYSAAMLAIADAKLAKGAIEPARLGIVMGSEMLYGEVPEMRDVFTHTAVDGKFQYDLWGTNAMRDLFPLWMLKYLPNMAACHIGIAIDARGPNNSIVQGAVSSLLAVIEAMSAIQRGAADVMIVGGSGSLINFSALTFRGWEQISKQQQLPAVSPRPFDLNRDGVLLGEGAGCLVLESREHAEKRGATLLAQVIGSASRCEAGRGPTIQGTAIDQSIAGALRSSQLDPASVGHVNAEAGGSVKFDALEAQAIQKHLGDVPVFAPKSYFGDLGAGSGAVELIASVLAIHQQQIPATLNFETPDPACPVNVTRTTTPLAKSAALVLNHSIFGQAAAVVLDAA